MRTFAREDLNVAVYRVLDSTATCIPVHYWITPCSSAPTSLWSLCIRVIFVFSASKGDPDYCSMPRHVQTVHRAAKSSDECFKIVGNVDFENQMFIKHISAITHTSKSCLIIYGSNEQLLNAPFKFLSPRMSLFSRPSSSKPRPLALSPQP